MRTIDQNIAGHFKLYRLRLRLRMSKRPDKLTHGVARAAKLRVLKHSACFETRKTRRAIRAVKRRCYDLLWAAVARDIDIVIISVYVDRNVVDHNLTLFDRAVYPTSGLRVTRINLNPLRLRITLCPEQPLYSMSRAARKRRFARLTDNNAPHTLPSQDLLYAKDWK